MQTLHLGQAVIFHKDKEINFKKRVEFLQTFMFDVSQLLQKDDYGKISVHCLHGTRYHWNLHFYFDLLTNIYGV